jgi:hypothetical protein
VTLLCQVVLTRRQAGGRLPGRCGEACLTARVESWQVAAAVAIAAKSLSLLATAAMAAAVSTWTPLLAAASQSRRCSGRRPCLPAAQQ